MLAGLIDPIIYDQTSSARTLRCSLYGNVNVDMRTLSLFKLGAGGGFSGVISYS